MPLEEIQRTALSYLRFVPAGVYGALLLALAAGAALLVHRSVLRLALRLVPRDQAFVHSLIRATVAPTRCALVIVALGAALPMAPIGPAATGFVAHGLFIGFIVLLGWSAVTAITLATDYYLRRSQLDTQVDPLARKHLTQVRVLRRVATTLVLVVTVAAALMTFESVKEYGVSLIASAGAAGLVVGLAARPLLTNLFAGIQLAITQPIRIGDAVIVENEWGWVEEITGTYVVIKAWDWRRLVVPLSYFLEKPFQNWTRSSTDLIGSVMLWVDYTVPVDRVRARLEEIVRGTKLWDEQVVNLQVVDANDRAVQLRALVSARTSPEAWDLRCHVREELIAFLQAEFPASLPKQRAELTDMVEGAGPNRSRRRAAAAAR